MIPNILLALHLLISSPQTPKLIKIKVNESVSMHMPADFRPMTDDEIAERFLSTKRPMALFTDPEMAVDLGVNKSVTQWKPADLEMMKDFQKSNIYSLYDDIDMLSEGIKEVNGRQYAYFEFVSSIKEDDNIFIKKAAISKYTYIQYTIVNEYSLVFNFTCPSGMRVKWQAVAGEMMNSVEVKRNP